MAVVSSKELPRKAEYAVGQPRKLFREFVCVLSDDTLAGSPTAESDIFTHLGIDLGSQHPVYAGYRVRTMKLTEGFEGSPYHTHVAFEYGLITLNELAAPTSRASVWEFDSQLGEVAALTYYDQSTGELRPLTNSAYDYFPGLMANESLAVAKVTTNFATFPSSWYGSMNCVNNGVYLGCPKHTIKVAKVAVRQEREEGPSGPVAFWQATAELHYRQSGHNLQLPDVGWNFLADGQKRRAMVFDFENSEWIASPNPVGLDGSGALTLGVPAILDRRISPEANFAAIFGTPPSAPLSI